MRKKIVLLILVIICNWIYAKDDLLNISGGKIKTIKLFIVENIEGKTKETIERIIDFDQKGNISCEQHFDYKGNLLYKNTYSPDGTLIYPSNHKYEYDKQGRVTESIHYDENRNIISKGEYKYTDNIDSYSVVEMQDGELRPFYYEEKEKDSNGNVVLLTEIYPDLNRVLSNIQEISYKNGMISEIVKRNINGLGKELRNKDSYIKEVYSYDSKGRISKIITYFVGRQYTQEAKNGIVNELKYDLGDKYGNYTLLTEYEKGVIKIKYRRELEYY